MKCMLVFGPLKTREEIKALYPDQSGKELETLVITYPVTMEGRPMPEEPERAPVPVVIEACAKIVAKRIAHDECREAMKGGRRLCRKCRQFEEIIQELYVLMNEW